MISSKKEAELPFNSLEFINAWQDWTQYRRERKLPKYVPTGLKRTFTKLFKDSGGNEKTAIEMIEYSMSQNYQGIFKQSNNASSKNGKPGFTESARKWIDAGS
jgi:hypothetical protein